MSQLWKDVSYYVVNARYTWYVNQQMHKMMYFQSSKLQICNASVHANVQCVLHTLDMTLNYHTRWCVMKVCNCKCAMWVCNVSVDVQCANVKCKWECKFSCKFVNVPCKCVSEVHKRAEVMKQVCLWNCRKLFGCKMYMYEWMFPLVCKYVMRTCGIEHAKKVRKFVCNVCEPVTRGCDHVKQLSKQIVSF